MTFRTLGRLRYDDKASDFIRDFPTRAEALEYLKGLGFTQIESVGSVTYFHLPGADERGRPVKLAGYLVEVR